MTTQDEQNDQGQQAQVTVQLRFVPEDPQDQDPAAVSETARSVVSDLRNEGYQVEPVYTGEKDIPLLFQIAPLIIGFAQQVWDNRELLLQALKTIQPIASYLEKRQAKQQAESDKVSQLEIEFEGVTFRLKDADLDNAEALLDKVLAARPQIVEMVSFQPIIIIRYSVPKPTTRRRRHSR
jgi:hypothetical protein